MAPEAWLPVPGYEGHYEISSFGRLASLKRGRRPLGGRPSQGYTRFALYSRDGVNAHKLVMRAFRGPCPDGLEACHNDGNRGNSRLDNLRYDTHTANMADAIRHGNTLPGERNPYSKLTVDAVLAIRALRGTESPAITAARFGITDGHVSNINAGRRWRHL